MNKPEYNAESLRQGLETLVRERSDNAARAWFDKALEAAGTKPLSTNKVLGYYSAASHKLGKAALNQGGAERVALAGVNGELPLDHWGLDEAGRAAILLSLAQLPPDEFRAFAIQVYELGDSREQESWLRALMLYPRCERFRDVAIDACRTNIKPLFEAVACENPYPCRYFPDLNFNQLVMKSLFMGVELARIIGLEDRLNPELSRMTDDYASEREAAGRAVPADIWLALAPFAAPAALERVYRYAGHADAAHRRNVAAGLGMRGDPAQRARLQERRQQERDPGVIAALDAALQRLASRSRSAG